MYRSFFAVILVSLGLFGAGSIAHAYTSPGTPDGYVNDYAGILSPQTETQLEAKLAAFEQKTQQEIAVVTISTTQDETVETYATKLFEEWGIGKKDKDNGALLLVAVQDKKLRIEVGYGLEGRLTDARSAQIISNAKPLLQDSKMEEAVIQMTDQMQTILETNEDPPIQKSSSGLWVGIAFLVGMFGLMGVICYFAFRSSSKFDKEFEKDWKEMAGRLKNVKPTMTSSRPRQKDSLFSSSSSSRSSNRSSSSSSSKSSFGGGKSGGGGASGSW